MSALGEPQPGELQPASHSFRFPNRGLRSSVPAVRLLGHSAQSRKRCSERGRVLATRGRRRCGRQSLARLSAPLTAAPRPTREAAPGPGRDGGHDNRDRGSRQAARGRPRPGRRSRDSVGSTRLRCTKACLAPSFCRSPQTRPRVPQGVARLTVAGCWSGVKGSTLRRKTDHGSLGTAPGQPAPRVRPSGDGSCGARERPQRPAVTMLPRD